VTARPSHVAIIQPRYADLILAGGKSVEARLLRQVRPPMGQVLPGDLIYFKRTGGCFAACASAVAVETHTDLTPARVSQLARRFRQQVAADPEFWRSKQAARHAVLITLGEIEPIERGPNYEHLRKQNPRSAWFVVHPHVGESARGPVLVARR
jgi:predicted transcriptional regulator